MKLLRFDRIFTIYYYFFKLWHELFDEIGRQYLLSRILLQMLVKTV